MASIANLTLPARALLHGFAAGDRRKFEAVLAWVTGQGSYREIAAEHGIDPATVLRWVRQFRKIAIRLCEVERIDPKSLVRGVDEDDDAG